MLLKGVLHNSTPGHHYPTAPKTLILNVMIVTALTYAGLPMASKVGVGGASNNPGLKGSASGFKFQQTLMKRENLLSS